MLIRDGCCYSSCRLVRPYLCSRTVFIAIRYVRVTLSEEAWAARGANVRPGPPPRLGKYRTCRITAVYSMSTGHLPTLCPPRRPLDRLQMSCGAARLYKIAHAATLPCLWRTSWQDPGSKRSTCRDTPEMTIRRRRRKFHTARQHRSLQMSLDAPEPTTTLSPRTLGYG